MDSDVYVGNSVLVMYLKFGDMNLPQKLFDKMPETDLVSWNTLLTGYVRNNNPAEVLVTFDLMGKTGVNADGTSLLVLLTACAYLTVLNQDDASRFFEQLERSAYHGIL